MASAATTLVTPREFFCWSAARFAESMMAVITTSSRTSGAGAGAGAGAGVCAMAADCATSAATEAEMAMATERRTARAPEMLDMGYPGKDWNVRGAQVRRAMFR